MNNNIFSSVESRLESIKSPEMIKDFIKTIIKINDFEFFNNGVFVLFSHDFIRLSCRGCREVKAKLESFDLNFGSHWHREDMGVREPSTILIDATSEKLEVISLPISHPDMGNLGYVSYLCAPEKGAMHAESILMVVADYLCELDLNRKHRLEDTANKLFIESQQSCFLMLDNDGFIVHASKGFYDRFKTSPINITNCNLFEFFLFPPKIKCKILQDISIVEENIDFDFSGQLKHLNITFSILDTNLRMMVFCDHKINHKKMTTKADNRLLPTLDTFDTYSPQMKRVINSAKEAVKNTSPIYILGEEGTGKRSLALTVHNSCETFKDGPFIAVNLHSVTKSDMSNLLLGKEGADPTKSKFELVNGGTLYIERIDLLPGVLQAALTHIILTKTLFDINTNRSVDLNFRLITSSIKPLDELVHERRFCPSLYFYLTGATLSLPSLHDRKEDIPYLINKKLKSLDVSNNEVDGELSTTLQEYALNKVWAGNLSELFKWIEHTYLNKSDLLLIGHDMNIAEFDEPIQTLEDLERREISNALSVLNRKYVDVAEQLGISQSTLRRKIVKYGI